MMVLSLALAAAPAHAARPEAVVLHSSRPAVRTVHATTPSTLSLAVRARPCSGAPRLVASVDGARVLSKPVRSRRWTTISVPGVVAAGAHTVRLRLANPLRTAHCRRSLQIRTPSLKRARQHAPGGPAAPGQAPGAPAPAGKPAAARWMPASRTSWQWQLSGTVDQSVQADMFDVDLFDTPASTVAALHAQGRRVTCYVDAGSFEPGRADAGEFPASVLGSGVEGWPGERWLDVRRLDALGPIMERRLDLCASKGFDAVEADNVDGYSNSSGFPLGAADQLRYNRFLASAAHARGLSIGLKNDFDQAAQLEPDFDWALSEQCFQYSECQKLRPFTDAGKPIFDAEYSGDAASYCAQANAAGIMAMTKRLELDAWRQPCW